MNLRLAHDTGPGRAGRHGDLLTEESASAAHLAWWVRAQAPSLIAIVDDDQAGGHRRIMGWALRHGDRCEVLVEGCHLSGLPLDEVLTTLDAHNNRLRAVTVYDPDQPDAGAAVSGEPDLTLPLGPQLSGRSRDDAVRLACLAELKAQAATGIAPRQLAARHGLTPHRLESLLREADLALHPDRPIGPQIRMLPLAHPVRRQGEAILAQEYLSQEHPDVVKRRHDVSAHLLYGALRRYCEGGLVAGMPLGPQLRVHLPGSPARVLAEQVIAREHAAEGAEVVRRRHLLSPRRLDTVLAAAAEHDVDAPLSIRP
ncbi:hypothetical protein [Saccharothrix xinjiangensis]|uniref:Uncharacterized protein n=1 Tax=Saccharothrix xinjiangensis TaxID=204798 RepID=A0ABV9Y313_9PSEU